MTAPLVVFGAGGHGKVVADILLTGGLTIAGFVDDMRIAGEVVFGLPVLGAACWFEENEARVALGIGDNAKRAAIGELIASTKCTLVAAIHPRAVVAASARVEPGAAVMALAVINPDAIIEQGAIVNTAAIVEHDCVVGAYAHVSPNSTMGGGCTVGRLAQLGIGATMLPGTSVGNRTIVGGGALVTRDVPAGVVASGVPARVRRPVA